MTTTAIQPLDCEHVVRQIWDWLDEELPAERWTAIAHHLATCTGCSEHVAFARGFLNKVNTPVPADAEFSSLKERIRTALRSESREPRR